MRPPKYLILLVLAAALILVLHLYATSTVQNSISSVEDTPQLQEFEISNAIPPGDPDRYIYSLNMSLENSTSNRVEVSLEDVELKLDGFNLGNVFGSPEDSIRPGGRVEFEAQPTLTKGTMEDLRSMGEIDMKVQGDLEVSSSFLWVKRSKLASGGINLTRKVLFE